MSPSERTLFFPNPHCLSYKVTARLSILTCLTIGGNCFRPSAECSSNRVSHGTPPKAEKFRCLDVQRPPDLNRLFVSASNFRTSLMSSREILVVSPRAPHPRMRHSSPKKHRQVPRGSRVSVEELRGGSNLPTSTSSLPHGKCLVLWLLFLLWFLLRFRHRNHV